MSIEEKDLKARVQALSPGDLVCCEWCDASTGKSSGSGTDIDVPVKSWGIFIGVLGEKAKHLVLAQNSFCYADGLFDLDYTAIPLSWAIDVSVLVKEHIPREAAKDLVNSFLVGGHRMFNHPRTFQQRLNTHGRPH